MASLQPTDALALLAGIDALARRAGVLILEVYHQDFAVRHKADASQLTLADERAEACIVPALCALTPGVPVVAEEACAAGEVPVVGPRFQSPAPIIAELRGSTQNWWQKSSACTASINPPRNASG